MTVNDDERDRDQGQSARSSSRQPQGPGHQVDLLSYMGMSKFYHIDF